VVVTNLGPTGKYIKEDDVATVRELDNRLEITNPGWGNYFLLPGTATEFVAEDAQKRVEFELDANGRATTVRIWFRHDEPYEMLRVP
jgi:hypothetical protein